jgi:hypothetical protein
VTMWREWMAATAPSIAGLVGRKANRVARYNEGLYVDNYYVRILTGQCGPCRPDLETVVDEKTGVYSRVPTSDPFGMQGCPAAADNVAYAAPLKDRLYLEMAKRQLLRFDMVLITESETKPREEAQLLRLAVGAGPAGDAAIADLRAADPEANLLRRVRDTKRVQGYKTSRKTDLPPDRTLANLRRENFMDIELYEWARARANRTEGWTRGGADGGA